VVVTVQRVTSTRTPSNQPATSLAGWTGVPLQHRGGFSRGPASRTAHAAGVQRQGVLFIARTRQLTR